MYLLPQERVLKKTVYTAMLILGIACCVSLTARANEFDLLLFDEEDSAQQVRNYTNSFVDMDLRQILHDISTKTNVRIIPDATVRGKVSGDFKDAPVEDVLQVILSGGNYSFRLMPEGYYLVGACTADSPSFNRLSITEYFQPNYLKVKELKSLIPQSYEPYVQINEDVNIVTITAAPEVVARIREDIAKFDQAPRQVMIEALVIEISRDTSKALGIEWGPMLNSGFNVSMPASTVGYTKTTGTDPARTTTISGSVSSDVVARINAMVARGQAKIKANPRVATLEGRQAEISVGTEEYATIEAGSPGNRYSTLQSISAGVILKITPFLDEKKQITVRIAPEVSEVTGQSSTGLPIITKRTALTTLRVDDGQMIAIGGLIQDQKSETTNKWPVLGSLPLVGPAFFQHKVSRVQSKEVIILITPHILQDTPFERMQKVSVSLDGSGKKADIAPRLDPAERYYYDISRLIESNKKFPDFIKEPRRGETQEVTVSFTVFSDGMITGATVVKSSGNSFLDENAVKSIEDLSPLPPFPVELTKTNITFTTTIRYES
jgi:TonB family protein